MKKINTELKFGNYLNSLNDIIQSNNIVVITDKNIDDIYGKDFQCNLKIVIESGEQSKSLTTAINIYNQLLENNVDRSWQLIGIGGGVVCDITGYVAATYMRGLDFSLVPTTLLAQCDAAIGGKNGVNLYDYKNIIGTFKQPKHIIIDTSFLITLEAKELRNGFAEIIKYGLIGNNDLFNNIEKNCERTKQLDYNILGAIIYNSIHLKLNIVQQDEFDISKRRVFNFGHTFAHAIELVYNLSHGEAVSIGMIKALEISHKILGMDKNLINRSISLLHFFDLPTKINYSIDNIIDKIQKDKKRSSNIINYILLQDIGKPILYKFTLDELKSLL